MIPQKEDRPLRKKGYKSQEEVEKRGKKILALFEDEKDKKTFGELFGKLKEKGWVKSTLWRYLERMVKNRKLIKEGKGKNAIYRCNLVELMELYHFAYLDKIRQICSQQGLSSFYDMGAVNCSILGIPSEDLTEYEKLVAETVVGKLLSSWLLLYSLRGNFSWRLLSKREVIGFYTMRSLYQHEINEILGNILEHQEMAGNPKMVKNFFKYLKKSMISWTKENKMRFPTNFWSSYSLVEQYDLEKADRNVPYPPLKYANENAELLGEELVAMTVTGNMMDSKEFSQRIENWLKYYLLLFFETARQFKFSKIQEIDEVVLEISKTISLRRQNLLPRAESFVLKKEEKERLLNWNLLLDRYGEKNTKFILDIVEEATSRFEKGENEILVHRWITEKTQSLLKQEGTIDQYAKEQFWE